MMFNLQNCTSFFSFQEQATGTLCASHEPLQKQLH
nr:MAG TPA: hypothetical protein [Siphoviridae sp. ctnpB30]DAO41426.1 MAG TPA: hypothetical protein [Caudoviricetes sp.]DAV74285.1 MAG TPA: hypothetical protein [Caudoviricetes sp.]